MMYIILDNVYYPVGGDCFWGVRRLQKLRFDLEPLDVFAGFYWKGCLFSREVVPNFAVNLSLEVVPARFTLGLG